MALCHSAHRADSSSNVHNFTSMSGNG